MNRCVRAASRIVILGLAFAIATSVPAAAVSGVVLWTRQFGSSGFDYAFAVAASGAHAYVAGRADGPVLGQSQIGGFDAFVAKYYENGNLVWANQFGTTDVDVAWGVAAGTSGVYVGGATNGGLAGPDVQYYDAFLRKYNADGSHAWTNQFGTTSDDVAYGVAIHGSESAVYVVGSMFGFPGSNSDAFVRKYDANGNVVWHSLFGSPSDDVAFGVAVGASGLYVAGRTFGTLSGQTSAGGADAFLRKVNSANGAEVWTRQFGSPGHDYGYGSAVDATGVYVAGETGGALPGQTSAGGADAFLRKYDGGGAELWTRQFGTPAHDRANGVAAEGDDPLVVGRTAGALPGWANLGGDDAFLRRYDEGGSVLWTNQFGTSADDEAFSVAFTTTYVAGATAGTLPGQTSAGNVDAFLNRWTEVGGCPPKCPTSPGAEP